jgi:hypothetical protein
VNIGGNSHVTRLLFIDDILIFCESTRRIIENLKDLIDLFYIVTFMKMNLSKTTISLWGINEAVQIFIVQMFPYNLVDVDTCLKYIRFKLKPNLYKIYDWQWLIAKVEKKNEYMVQDGYP